MLWVSLWLWGMLVHFIRKNSWCFSKFMTMMSIFNIAEGSVEMNIGIKALRTISLSFVLAGASITISCVFQAFGKSIYSMFVSIARQLVVLLPAAYLLANFAGGLETIWWAFPISELMSIAACITFFVILWHRTIKKIPLDGPVIRTEDI